MKEKEEWKRQKKTDRDARCNRRKVGVECGHVDDISTLFQQASLSDVSSCMCSLCGINFDDDDPDCQWIGCDCDRWWHLSCINMEPADVPEGSYYCGSCK